MIYYLTVMARYSLFVLKVPLNPKQTNKLYYHNHHHQHEVCVNVIIVVISYNVNNVVDGNEQSAKACNCFCVYD